jgi:hypothetical protein
LWLIVFLEQAALCAQQTAWNKPRIGSFVNPLHLCAAFWVLAFGVSGVWHDKMYTTFYLIKLIGQKTKEI